jgi:hypothetical protein
VDGCLIFSFGSRHISKEDGVSAPIQKCLLPSRNVSHVSRRERFGETASQRCNRRGNRGTSMTVPALVIDFTSLCGKFPRLKGGHPRCARQSTQPRDRKIVHSGKKGAGRFFIRAAVCPGRSCHSCQL